MNINFLQEAESLREKLLDIRKELHRVPEIGNHEFKTCEILEKYLDEAGITHKRILDTAIIARLEGSKPGKHSALRSDIDALPINESTGCNFASQHEGFMHACGHDVHMTGVLGAAMILARNRDKLSGSVSFFFQPDEEGDGGALRMIEAGALEGIDAVFGAHVDPALKAGDIGIRYGDFYAASAEFRINVVGKPSHGAQRDKGIDALQAGAALVPEILAMNKPGSVVTVGKFHSGTANNIVAGLAELGGIMRTFGVDKRAAMCSRLEEIVSSVSSRFNAKSECFINTSCPGIVNNHTDINKLVEDSARETLGSEHVIIIEKPLMISEDFGYFIMDKIGKQGSFYHIGAGCEYPLHSDKFLPADDAIITACAVHAAVVSKFNSL